jgi:copper transport protein
MMPRRTARVAVAGVAVVVLLVATAGTASAHARLVSTDPAASSVLLVPPAQVVLHFDDVVTIDGGSLRVFGPDGTRVDDGGVHHPGGDRDAVAVGLPAGRGPGSYVVAWRVISDDGHPVHGAYVFSVGSDRGAVRASVVAGALATESGSPGVGAVAGVLRWAALVGLLTLVGLTVLVALVWPEGGPTPRVGRILWAAWGVLFVATVAGIAVEGVYAALLPLGDALRPSLAAEVLRTRSGRADAARALLLVGAVPVLLGVRGHFGVGHRRPRWLLPSVLAVGSGLLVTTGLAGHATTGAAPAVGLALDVVHLGAASVWVGGLVLLAAFLVGPPSRVPQPVDPGAVIRTVSAWLLAAAAAVVGSGTGQAFRQVGSRYALFHTTYGRTLLVKLALVLALVSLGALSRRLVHGTWGLRRTRRPGAPARVGGGAGTPALAAPRRSRLRWSVVAETALVVAVLGVTSLLVADVPARQAAGLPFAASVTTAGAQVNVIVDPARAGIGNEVHVYVLSGLGTPEALLGLDAVLRLPSGHVGPIRVPMRLSGPGHYYATDVVFPVAGTWDLTLTVRTASGRSGSATVALPVH